MLYLAVGIYTAAIIASNLSVAMFGPAITPINAFVLIGLDLALRDWLHVRLKGWQMLALILCAGLLSYLLNPDARQIALASACAFSLAATADWLAFLRIRGSWLTRANGSNVAGAAVDSIVFPVLAFGAFLPQIILMQFLAKMAGGAVWSFMLNRYMRRQGGALAR